MPRLTDKQRKQIIADYVELGSYRAVAKKHGVTADTVKRAVLGDATTAQKATQKKEQNTADVLAHMDAKRDTVNQIIDKTLDVLNDEEKLSYTGPMQLATMLGILIDKFTATRPTVEKLRAEVSKAVGENPRAMEDDPITKSLKEEAEHGLL